MSTSNDEGATQAPVDPEQGKECMGLRPHKWAWVPEVWLGGDSANQQRCHACGTVRTLDLGKRYDQ